MKKEYVGGRWYGLSRLSVVVAQIRDQMIVQSRHHHLVAAKKKAEKLAKRSYFVIYGFLDLLGNPTKDYNVGDVLDPDDISWSAVPGRCSMCCHPYAGRPNSLNYKCHISNGSSDCEAVLAHRCLPQQKNKNELS